MLGYGETTTDATANLNVFRANAKTEGWSLGAYSTWYQNDHDKLGWYVDAWGTYGWFTNKVQGELLPEVKYDARALTLSGETGYAMRAGLRVYRTWTTASGGRVEPYVTVNWWHTSVSDAETFNQLSLGNLYPKDRYEVKVGANADIGRGWNAWGNVGYQWGGQDYRSTSIRLGAKYIW